MTISFLNQHTGTENLHYDQFIKLYGIRNKVDDLTNPRVRDIGDIELPKKSLLHYLPSLPGEIGPGNENIPFLYNTKNRVNLYFNWEFKEGIDSGGIQKRAINKQQIETNYFKTHFRFTRIKKLMPFIDREYELSVNNLAPAFINVNYIRTLPVTGFFRYVNEVSTTINAVNQIASISDCHQFWEIKLPNHFVTYSELKNSFERYGRHLDSKSSKPISQEIIKPFTLTKSYWLLDLYAFLLYDEQHYSFYNTLSEKGRERCNFIFTFGSKCLIVNINTLLRLIRIKDKEGDKNNIQNRILLFKRFYLILISMVSNITIDTPSVIHNNEKEQQVSQGSKSLDTHPDNRTVDINNASNQGNVHVRSSAEREKDGESEVGVPHQEPDYDDTKEIDLTDEELDKLISSTETVTVNKTKKYSPTAGVTRALDKKAKEGKLTEREREFFNTLSNRYKEITLNGKTIEDIIDIKSSDMILSNKKIASDANTIIDKSVLSSRTFELKKGYVDNLLERNIVESIVYAQNAGLCITDLKKDTVKTASNCYDVWTFDTHPIDGNKRTNSFRIPKVSSDCTFKVNDVTSYMQIQRMEKPVRKVSEIAVQLTSYYDKGRIRIERSKKVVDDYSRWLNQQVIRSASLYDYIKVTLGSVEYKGKNVCYYYSLLAQRFSSIKIRSLLLDFDTSKLLTQSPGCKKYCNNDTWCVGIKDNDYLIIDRTGLLSWNGDEVIGYIEDLLNISTSKAPLPTATININGYRFPIVVVLSYWMGFNNVLKAIGAEYKRVDINTRVQLEPHEYTLVFADEKLIFNRRDELTTLVVSGLNKLSNIRELSRGHLDDPNIWFRLMDDVKVKAKHFSEMSQMYDMFIDPITKRLLEKDNYPTSMEHLCLAAMKLLLNRYKPAETEITEQRFVGYERFAGHVYKELCRATRQYRNKPSGNKRTFDLNPESIMLNIITDSSVQAIEEVNPFHQLKQQEEVTFGGTMGQAEQAMVKRTRGMIGNYKGIISEAGKDSGKIGYVTYLTSDAKLVDYYGNINTELPNTKSGMGSVTMNTLYGGTHDDPKRSLFTSCQRSQMMATVNYTSSPIRMSYDTVLSQRTNEIYSSIAKQDGKVISIDNEFGLVVEYADGTVDKFPLGLAIGRASGEYHRHNKITDMKVGDTFKQADILAFDSLFFERDMFNKGKVVIKYALLTRIALFEDQATYEDSIAVTKSFAEMSAVPFIKINTVNIYDDEIIKLFVKIGDTVEYNQVLADIEDESTRLSDSEQSLSGLERFGVKQTKANLAGKVVDIELLYNGQIENFHPETQKVIKKFDNRRAKKSAYQADEVSHGNIGGNTHVVKLDVPNNSIKINIYIEQILSSTTADKLVSGNQMKGTIGYIYPVEITTLDGRPVHMLFSVKSLLARMVLSMIEKMLVNELNNVYTHRLIERIEGVTNWKI